MGHRAFMPNRVPKARPSAASGSNGLCAGMAFALARRYRVCTTDSRHFLPVAANLPGNARDVIDLDPEIMDSGENFIAVFMIRLSETSSP
jgi:hypothetical protein